MFKSKIFMIVTAFVIMLSGCSVGGGEGDDSKNIKNTASFDDGGKKLKVIFTIDAEDKRGNVPNLIEGDLTPFGSNVCGINYIMDSFEKYGFKGVFFTNIYESNLYDGEYKDYIPNLLKRIDERGHEIGLHNHSTKAPDYYTTDLNKMDLETQTKLLQYGIDIIQNSIGKKPIAFRAGSYKINDDTFKALENLGIKYDCSYLYWHDDFNLVSKRNSINQMCKVGNITEFPVQVVHNGTEKKKMDFDSLTKSEDYIKVFDEALKRDDYPVMVIMFHTFTFLRTTPEYEGEKPLIIEKDKNIYGEKTDRKKCFEEVLDYINKNDNIEVITFEDLDKMNMIIPSIKSDGIFEIN